MVRILSNVGVAATIDFAASNTNFTIAKTGAKLSFDITKKLAIDSVTIGNSKLDNNGLAITLDGGFY